MCFNVCSKRTMQRPWYVRWGNWQWAKIEQSIRHRITLGWKTTVVQLQRTDTFTVYFMTFSNCTTVANALVLPRGASAIRIIVLRNISSVMYLFSTAKHFFEMPEHLFYIWCRIFFLCCRFRTSLRSQQSTGCNLSIWLLSNLSFLIMSSLLQVL